MKKLLYSATMAFGIGVAIADDTPATLVKRIEENESIARITTSQETRYQAYINAARISFELSEPEGEKSGEYAQRGLELANRARRTQPNDVQGHYLYAICLGIYLRENNLDALSRLEELIRAAKRAEQINERYDHGGPHRLLARIYAEAPRLIGPGDYDLAKKHTEKLLEIDPDFTENKITAARVYIETGDKQRARDIISTIEPATQEQRSEKRKLEKEAREK